MFEKIFLCPTAIAAYREAPLVDDRQRYLLHWKDNGAKRSTLRQIASVQLNLVKILDLQIDERVSIEQIEAAAKQWAKPGSHRKGRPACAKATKTFIQRAARWLRFVERVDEPNTPHHCHAAEVDAFAKWMRQQCGLAESTIKFRCRVIDQFFDWLDECGITVAAIEITNIDQVLMRYTISGQCCRSTINLYAKVIRSFFRFAEQRSWCTAGLADSIIPPRVLPDQSIPKGLTREEVVRLLATTEGERPSDLRDRAILMLLITYGLRASEVCNLQLDDLNWQQDILRVRCTKSGRTLYHPLSRSVGESIIRYLSEVRPKCSQRALFLTLIAPLGAINGAAVYQLVAQRMEKIGITGKSKGPHVLRHAAAQHLLDQGLSMKHIGDYLGHRSINTTAVYAKVDLNALREVAEVDLEGLI